MSVSDSVCTNYKLACGDVRKGFEWLVPPTVVPVKNVVELGGIVGRGRKGLKLSDPAGGGGGGGTPPEKVCCGGGGLKDVEELK